VARLRNIALGVPAIVVAGWLAAMADPLPAATRISSIEVRGTAFRVTLASGTALEGPELAGATISVALIGDAEPRRVRLARIVPDPMDRDGEIFLYDMRLVDPVTGGSTPLCEHAVDGEHWAFPLRGQWDQDGRRISDAGFTLTCAADAQGKCVRFGYKPWKTTPSGVALADYHQACIRMVRADYCGNSGTTRDGMLIDFYDRLGIQKKTASVDDQTLPLEAAWNAAGAVCVAHTRVPENMTMERLAQTCPRLRGRLGNTACTETKAEPGDLGQALLLNRSP
jgi:ADYC domain-containing protein